MRAFGFALVALVMICVLALPASAVLRNAGEQIQPVMQDNHITIPTDRDAVRVLYCPSEADDPGYRALVVAALPAGSVVDYYDARNGTPDATLLSTYNAVHTWANYAYNNNVLMGDNLADFIDADATHRVVLGAFCTYCFGNFLSGRIMTAAYCPVYSPSCSNHFSTAYWAGDDADKCDYLGVTSWGAFYRDYLSLQGAGIRWGTFTDGEIADAVGPNEAVHYVNGSGGAPILVDNGVAIVVANACYPCGGTPVLESTWGAVKALYR